jgi:hypothetical protein
VLPIVVDHIILWTFLQREGRQRSGFVDEIALKPTSGSVISMCPLLVGGDTASWGGAPLVSMGALVLVDV